MAARRSPDGDALPSPATAGQGPPFTGYRKADWEKANIVQKATLACYKWHQKMQILSINGKSRKQEANKFPETDKDGVKLAGGLLLRMYLFNFDMIM